MFSQNRTQVFAAALQAVDTIKRLTKTTRPIAPPSRLRQIQETYTDAQMSYAELFSCLQILTTFLASQTFNLETGSSVQSFDQQDWLQYPLNNKVLKFVNILDGAAIDEAVEILMTIVASLGASPVELDRW